MKTFTPLNQVRLTNVAEVRLKKGSKMFSVACYKNKVLDYRAGRETNIREVLQNDIVFTNISRGDAAKSLDIKKNFPDCKTVLEVCRRIINEGKLQISEKEREQEDKLIYKNICNTVAEKCINPTTRRRYPITVIENSLKKGGFQINNIKNISSGMQVSNAVSFLNKKKLLDIIRAPILFRAMMKMEDADKFIKQEKCVELMSEYPHDSVSHDKFFFNFLCSPENSHKIESYISENNGTLQIVNPNYNEGGTVVIEDYFTEKGAACPLKTPP